MVLEMAMASLFAVVDVFWVARLGTSAVATVGLTESLVTILFTVAAGLGMSTAAVVARRIGEADQRTAAQTAVQSLLIRWVGSISPATLNRSQATSDHRCRARSHMQHPVACAVVTYAIGGTVFDTP
jgi:Na+-driven multidrug efflux pump